MRGANGVRDVRRVHPDIGKGLAVWRHVVRAEIDSSAPAVVAISASKAPVSIALIGNPPSSQCYVYSTC
jgi:hypothetical protein